MCRCLNLPRSTFYYEAQEKKSETPLRKAVVEIFHANRDAYGSRKIKDALSKIGLQVSRRRIRRIMKLQGINSKYTVAQFKVHKQTCNEDKIDNKLNRQFDNQEPYAVVISDLTYVRVRNKWNYICLLVDLFNREIIGYSAGRHKDAQLVSGAFSKVNTDSLDQLKLELADYVNWFNNFRTHSAYSGSSGQRSGVIRPSLGRMSSESLAECRRNMHSQLVKLSDTGRSQGE